MLQLFHPIQLGRARAGFVYPVGPEDRTGVPLCLSIPIRNYGDVLTVIFHHRDTEDTETLFLFANRETTIGKKRLSIGWKCQTFVK
jgi:hypothetical protein